MGIFSVIFLASFLGPEKEAKEAIDVKVVRYDGLKDVVRKNRGQVVVVFFWANWNPPSIVNLRHFFAMHSKYATKGLETVTVDIGYAQLDGNLEGTRKILTHARDLQNRLTTVSSNLILDEEYDFLADKIGPTPFFCAFVFNRQGKWVRFSIGSEEEPFGVAAIEKAVVKFLQEK